MCMCEREHAVFSLFLLYSSVPMGGENKKWIHTDIWRCPKCLLKYITNIFPKLNTKMKQYLGRKWCRMDVSIRKIFGHTFRLVAFSPTWVRFSLLCLGSLWPAPGSLRLTGCSILSPKLTGHKTISKGKRNMGQIPQETKSILPSVFSAKSHTGCT